FRFSEPELPDLVFTEYLTGALYLDSRQEVATHLEVLDHMSARAASAERTKKLLRERREDF
ncbi:MAG: transcriptional regulator, partial [Streptomyces sp.]|nr:transcriptional regulator [Streptomyces sp.]